jgi:hypothetical protein
VIITSSMSCCAESDLLQSPCRTQLDELLKKLLPKYWCHANIRVVRASHACAAADLAVVGWVGVAAAVVVGWVAGWVGVGGAAVETLEEAYIAAAAAAGSNRCQHVASLV